MMWNNLSKLAERAKVAAENLEGQLNESVGLTPEVLSARSKSSLDTRHNENDVGNKSIFNSFGRGLLTALSDDKNDDSGGDDDDDDDDDFFNDDPFYEDDLDVDVNMHDNNDASEKVTSNNGEDNDSEENDHKDNEIKEATIEEENEEEEVETTTETDQESVSESTSINAHNVDNKYNIHGSDDPKQNIDEHDDNHSGTVEFFRDDDGIVENDTQQIIMTLSNSKNDDVEKNKSSYLEGGSDQVSEAAESNDYELKNNDTSMNAMQVQDETERAEDNIVNDTEVAQNSISIGSQHSNDNVEDNTNDEQQYDDDAAIYENDGAEHDTSEMDGDNEMNEDVGDTNYNDNTAKQYEEMEENNDTKIFESKTTEQIEINLIPNEPQESEEKEEDEDEDEDDVSIYVSKEEIMTKDNINSDLIDKLQSEIFDLQNLLSQREGLLTEKAEQMFSMVETHEKEKSFLEAKVRETKEEAKKRIGKAKERVDAMQLKLAEAVAKADSVGSSSNEQEEIIQALRKEGETLAMKQSKMEELVRDARSELRDVKEALESEIETKEKTLEKLDEVTKQLNKTMNDLAEARKGEGRAEKLDSDLLAEREEREKNASKILSLEATIKEMKAKHTEKIKDMEIKMSEQVSKVESEKSSIGREKDNYIKDLELKLRTSEREANLREDSLRHELAELRKRWQDSVRRSDALSIDLQQSSAPLLRQLESAERQSRARASAWAEIESKLRADLEENIFKNEKLNKERYQIDLELKRLMRAMSDRDSELQSAQSKIQELNQTLESKNTEYKNLLVDLENIQGEYDRCRTQYKENESKIRNEMAMSLRESEERYNDTIESLEVDLRQEKDKRIALEEKIKNINTSALLSNNVMNGNASAVSSSKTKKRNLSGKENQVDILQSTLFGLNGSESDDEIDGEEDNENVVSGDVQESFAFIEQLSQALKAAKSEKETLRNQLLDSEEKRNVLENECALSKDAVDRLPGLEAKILELSRMNEEKDLEIQGLSQDIFEVRQMYRSQLDILLEEKASGSSEVDSTVNKKESNQSSSSTVNGHSMQQQTMVPPRYGMMPSF